MTAGKFNEILDFIRDEKIVCPMPDYWHLMWEEICGTKINANPWSDDDIEIARFTPLILSGWDSEDVKKHERFIGLIHYFYENYPEKQILIEKLVFDNKKWLRWSGIEYRPNDRFVRSKKVIDPRCADHNVARWEWIGLDGKNFSEIDARNSEYRKHTADGVEKFILNESPITSHLDYDIESEYIHYESEYIDNIKSK